MKKKLWICMLILGAMLSWGNTCTAEFYVIPGRAQVRSWDEIISSPSRFKLVMSDAAVLDRETGLVWERTPVTGKLVWNLARGGCYKREVANRFGWRLPTIEELSSLVDNGNSNPSLPAGHPFNIQLDNPYWTTTSVAWFTTYAYTVRFSNGNINEDPKGSSCYYWCVRGGHGYDAFSPETTSP
jgi:hypothetical protein